MNFLIAWATQPTTVAGASAMLGTLLAVFTHQLNWSAALPLIAGAATSIVLPDNTALRNQVQALTSEIVNGKPAP